MTKSLFKIENNELFKSRDDKIIYIQKPTGILFTPKHNFYCKVIAYEHYSKENGIVIK